MWGKLVDGAVMYLVPADILPCRGCLSVAHDSFNTASTLLDLKPMLSAVLAIHPGEINTSTCMPSVFASV